MIRTLLFIVILTLIVLVAVWLSQWGEAVTLVLPGQDLNLLFTKLAWPDYELTLPFGLLVFAILVLGVVMALLYRLWLALRSAPGRLGGMFAGSRTRRGYRALTQGMVAVAAGDADEARKWSRRADELLDDPPLTQLLAAQSAQLEGDEAAAKRYFTKMLEREDMKFLGLRGLLMQAMREGDDAAARDLVRQAYALRPRTPWVLNAMFDLSEKAGELEAAEKAVNEAAKLKILPAAEAQRKKAVVMVERSEAARTAGNRPAAIKHAQAARRLDPKLVPATALLAELFCAAGRHRDAARVLERAWAQSPHPDLVEAYRKAQPSDDPIQRFKNLSKLIGGKTQHVEGALALAEAALEASLWGEARRYLGQIAEPTPDERVCRLMARLEEAEHNDTAKSREWLMRASDAPSAPSWVCDSCGTAAAKWSPRCEACSAYDSLQWGRPPRVTPAPLLAADGGTGDGSTAPEAPSGTATLLPPTPANSPAEGAANGNAGTKTLEAQPAASAR